MASEFLISLEALRKGDVDMTVIVDNNVKVGIQGLPNNIAASLTEMVDLIVYQAGMKPSPGHDWSQENLADPDSVKEQVISLD